MSDWQQHDPEFSSEEQKYEFPIPSRTYLISVLESSKKPMTFEELVVHLDIEKEDQMIALSHRVRAMLRDGQAILNRKQGLVPISAVDLVVGRVQAHKDGHGFLILDDGGDDWFIPPREMKLLFHSDRAVARQSGFSQKGHNKAAIVEVLELDNEQQFVGRLHFDGSLGYVQPEDPRIQHEIFIERDDQLGAKEGQVVVVRLTQRPGKRQKALGMIIEVLGEHLDPGMEIEIAIRKFELPHRWNDAVLDQVSAIDAIVQEKDKKNRVDLTKLPLVTIDGEDARDFDDAVYCEPKASGGWKLWVAIADVSHYVTPDTALDIEALKRGNSVYFPGNVIPMLPEKLSNGLCSLNPHLDRLAFVCEMTISEAGNLSGFKFYPAVIHSHARLTYTEVWNHLNGDESLSEDKLAVAPHLEHLYQLYKTLDKARQSRGTINFETIETLIEFNEARKISDIVPRERNPAHKIIEECMILANVACAGYAKKHKLHSIYRVHSGPSERKLTVLREYLSNLGLWLFGGDDPTPKDYASLLNEISQRPDYDAIQTMVLRSMSQAVYGPKNEGHFGLSLKGYSHFTSPIRRYPDLIAHRIIKGHLESLGEQAQHGCLYTEEALAGIGEQCSITERRADEATRDVTEWLKCEYMLQKIGNEYKGTVTHVTNFGLFVRLEDVFVEGLVHVTNLQHDYFHFDATQQRLFGENSGVSYSLGDELQVRVLRVDLEDRKIDFELAEQKKPKAMNSAQKERIKATLEKIAREASLKNQKTGSKKKSDESGDDNSKPKSKKKMKRPSTTKKKSRTAKQSKRKKSPKKR
jgi:ribonuclease R